MKLKLTLVATILAIVLAACGGGGSNESSEGGTTLSPVTPPRVIEPSDLQLTVPTPTYGANSANLASFNAINEFRASLGLGLWAQNTKLDMAAQNHVDYLVGNNIYSGHGELKELNGFTGVDATKRAAYIGYIANWVGEVGTPGVGILGINSLIDTVYHRSALMNQQMTEVGIANSANPHLTTQWINFSNATKKQNNESNFIAVYPLNGQQNVSLLMMGESINPFPSIPFPSLPISFISAEGTKLTVTSFTVTVQGHLIPLITRLITKENDINQGYLPAHEAYIAGIEPFLPNTVYNVSFVGKVNEMNVSKNWSFTTGNY